VLIAPREVVSHRLTSGAGRAISPGRRSFRAQRHGAARWPWVRNPRHAGRASPAAVTGRRGV